MNFRLKPSSARKRTGIHHNGWRTKTLSYHPLTPALKIYLSLKPCPFTSKPTLLVWPVYDTSLASLFCVRDEVEGSCNAEEGGIIEVALPCRYIFIIVGIEWKEADNFMTLVFIWECTPGWPWFAHWTHQYHHHKPCSQKFLSMGVRWLFQAGSYFLLLLMSNCTSKSGHQHFLKISYAH